MLFFDGVPLLFGALTVTQGVLITTANMLQVVGFTATPRSTKKVQGIAGKHYDIACSDGSYSSWQASMASAKQGKPHANTIKLMGVVYFVSMDYCGTVS